MDQIARAAFIMSQGACCQAKLMAMAEQNTKCDLEEHDLSLVEAVFVYERKGTVRSEQIAKWS